MARRGAGRSGLSGLSRLSGWPDRQAHQANERNQIDQRNQMNQMNKSDERWGRLEKNEWWLGSCVGSHIHLDSCADCFIGCL